MLTDNLISEFLLSLAAKQRAQRTINEYASRLRELRRRLPVELEQIGAVELDCVMADLRQRELAAATLATYIQTLRTLFAFAVRRGYISASPAADLHRPKLNHSARRKAMPQADLRALIGQARREERTLELAVLMLAADSGCRAGELLALQVDALDLARMEATTSGKTGERVIDFTAPTLAALRAWLEIRPGDQGPALFPLTYNQLYARLKRLAVAAGVKRFGLQSIRHRVGQGWIDAGANLELVRIKLGHADITTTSRFYAHQDRPRMRAASKRYSLVKS